MLAVMGAPVRSSDRSRFGVSAGAAQRRHFALESSKRIQRDGIGGSNCFPQDESCIFIIAKIPDFFNFSREITPGRLGA